MQIGILITAAATPAAASDLLGRIDTLLRPASHTLYRIFLYGDAVHLARASQDTMWDSCRRLGQTYAGRISVCAAAAQRRGVVSDDNRVLADGFTLTGLGDWVDMVANCDHIAHIP